MKIINTGLLKAFADKHPDVRQQLWTWYYDLLTEEWTQPLDILERYRTADTLPGSRAVFNIKGNRYRIVVRINYDRQLVEIRFIGTHSAYDRIDAVNI